MKIITSLFAVLGALSLMGPSLHAQYIAYGTSAGGTTWTSNSLFQYQSGGTLYAQGTFGTGSMSGDEGAGTRMLWYPKKAAFRAGRAYTSFLDASNNPYYLWDDVNIGNYSVAMGFDTSAKGIGSIALGFNSTANVNYATAIGYGLTASGFYAAAFGNGSTASGNSSFAVGETNTAEGGRSFAFGSGNVAHGGYSFAGIYQSQAVGSYSTALGFQAYSRGKYSVALGYGAYGGSYGCTAIGYFNSGSGDANNPQPNEPLFQVGNGTDDANRSNALSLDKSGNLTVSTVTLKASPATGDIPMFGH